MPYPPQFLQQCISLDVWGTTEKDYPLFPLLWINHSYLTFELLNIQHITLREGKKLTVAKTDTYLLGKWARTVAKPLLKVHAGISCIRADLHSFRQEALVCIQSLNSSLCSTHLLWLGQYCVVLELHLKGLEVTHPYSKYGFHSCEMRTYM